MADVLFTNVRIFDGGGETPFDGEVLVSGNRISRVTPTRWGQRTPPVGGTALAGAASSSLGFAKSVGAARSASTLRALASNRCRARRA